MTIVGTQPGRLVRNADGGYFIPPPSDFSLIPSGPYVWDALTAKRIPAVARCLDLYSGMCKQMPIDAWRGAAPLDRPRLLSAPDPNKPRSWFVHVSVEDYLLYGNAISLVTSRGADGWPTSIAWLPAVWCTIQWSSFLGPPEYYFVGEKLPIDDVIHVMRGVDRMFPIRGVGVIEEHLADLDRVAMESEYERAALAGGAVPSVAIIANTAALSQETADETKATWITKFAGPTREPAILPNGSQVIPLAWSPTDAQLTEARRLSLTDVANMFNLDGFWLGAPVAGMTYRTVGPEYQSLLRTSLEPVLVDFEGVWGDAWLPRGQSIRFDRFTVLRDDFATMSTALATLTAAGIIEPAEARAILALPAVAGDGGAQLDAPSTTAPAADSTGDTPADPGAAPNPAEEGNLAS